MKVQRLQIEYTTFREDDMARLFMKGCRDAKTFAKELKCSVSTVYRIFKSDAFYNSLMNHGIKRPTSLTQKEKS